MGRCEKLFGVLLSRNVLFAVVWSATELLVQLQVGAASDICDVSLNRSDCIPVMD